MNIKTAYGNAIPLNKEEQEQFRIIASKVSDKMSIRNPNRHEFVKKLTVLIEEYNKKELEKMLQ